MIIEILLYCSPEDIVNVGEAHDSQNVWNIISSLALWKTLVIGPPGDAINRKYLKYFGSHISSLTIEGLTTNAENNLSTLTKPFLNTIKRHCNQLKSLSLKNCILNLNAMRSSLFPKTIVNLTLDHIEMAITGIPATLCVTEDYLDLVRRNTAIAFIFIYFISFIITIFQTNVAEIWHPLHTTSPYHQLLNTLPHLTQLKLIEMEYETFDSLSNHGRFIKLDRTPGRCLGRGRINIVRDIQRTYTFRSKEDWEKNREEGKNMKVEEFLSMENIVGD